MNKFFNPPIESCADMSEFKNKENDENPSRISEPVVSALNRVMGGNSETKICQNSRLHCHGTWNGNHQMNDEMKLFRMFYDHKRCVYEDRCRFRSVIETGGSSTSRGFKGFVGEKVNAKPVMWKTKLCRNWEMSRSCLYGKMCYFAHGQEELRKLGNHNAFKSQIVPMNISNAFSTANNENVTTCKQQEQGTKCVFKCKEQEKISGIYADWIEDMPLMCSSLNEAEN